MTEFQWLFVSEMDAARRKHNKMLFVVVNCYPSEELQHDIQQMDIPTCNVSLLLSEQLRQLSPERRPFEVGKILRSFVMQENKDVIFLNRIEYLFDRELNQNPVQLFENLSRNKLIIVQWPGIFESNVLTYATREHHEYYQSDDSYASYVIEI